MTRQLTPGAPLPVLVGAYARAGWIGLDESDMRCARAILDALARLLDPRSGQGFVTVPQIADTARYGDRQTRKLLAVLEDMRLISWTRGGIVSGRPQPSIIRVYKTTLLALIRRARPALERIRKIRADRTAARLAGLRSLTVKPRRSKASVHAALSASPSPYRGRDAAGPSRPDPEKEIEMHDPHTGTTCDKPGCRRRTRRPQLDGWINANGKNYCPDHDPLPRGYDTYEDPNTMTDAALALTNRVRAMGGLPPLVRTIL